MNEGQAGRFLVKSTYASKSKGEGLGWGSGEIDGVREKTGIFFVAGEKLSLETLKDSPARGSHRAEAKEP